MLTRLFLLKTKGTPVITVIRPSPRVNAPGPALVDASRQLSGLRANEKRGIRKYAHGGMGVRDVYRVGWCRCLSPDSRDARTQKGELQRGRTDAAARRWRCRILPLAGHNQRIGTRAT